jgi:hypothetical protein
MQNAKPYLQQVRDYLRGRTVDAAQGAVEDFFVAGLGPTGRVLLNVPKATDDLLSSLNVLAVRAADPSDSASLAQVFKESNLEQRFAEIVFNTGSPTSKLAGEILKRESVSVGVTGFVTEEVAGKASAGLEKGINSLFKDLLSEYAAAKATKESPEQARERYRRAYEEMTKIVGTLRPDIINVWTRVSKAKAP